MACGSNIRQNRKILFSNVSRHHANLVYVAPGCIFVKKKRRTKVLRVQGVKRIRPNIIAYHQHFHDSVRTSIPTTNTSLEHEGCLMVTGIRNLECYIKHALSVCPIATCCFIFFKETSIHKLTSFHMIASTQHIDSK